jgi:hypothetical protein
MLPRAQPREVGAHVRGTAGQGRPQVVGAGLMVEAGDLVRMQRRHRGMLDQGVPKPRCVELVAAEQDLGQLLARPQARVHDVDLARGAGGQPPRDVVNQYSFPHVEDEDLAVAPDDRRLQDQLNSFVRGHEVTADLRVSHRYRAAGGHLRGKCGQHRPTATEDISETDTQIRPVGAAGQIRGEPFPDPFGVAEHADWIRGLVRRDVHERLDAVGGGRLQHGEGAPHVAFQRLGGIALE